MRVKKLVKMGVVRGSRCPTGFLLKTGDFLINGIAEKILC